MSQSTRVFSIWGSPGFGKTSTAIAIGNQLKDQGENVYYFSFRGVSTMKEFTSKLLGLFGRSIDFQLNLLPTDQLLHALGSIKARMFVVLDNLDDILTSGNQKEAMLNFIIDVLQRCSYMNLLTTTRESLEFVTLRVQDFDSLRLKPLDAQSSSSLVLTLLQPTMADLPSQISKMCGNVPLAIRLLCSLIKDSPQEFLDEIVNGSEYFLDVIDDDDIPSDARLKELIRTSFNKLSNVEKRAFVSLSLFGGAEFGLDAGIAIVGGSKLQAKRSIESLKKKSLIDIDGETYAIHPLIQSFALEKGQNEMENVMASSRTRFLEYYINLFENLNMRFLKGDSMSAFKTFYMDEQRIFTSLTDGLRNSEFLEKVVGILKECEFFLDSLYPNSTVKIQRLYKSTLSKACDRKFDKDFAGLYSSKYFFKTIYVSKTFSPLLRGNDETSRKLSLLPLPVQGKLACYKGIFELSNGGGEPAAKKIENGLLQLDNSPQGVILKILGFQFLAIYYKCKNNAEKSEHFLNNTADTCAVNSVFCHVPLLGKPLKNEEKFDDTSCLTDQPLAAWGLARLSLWTRKHPCKKFGKSLDLFLKQISGESSKLVWTVELCTLLQLVDKTYIHLGISNETSNFDQASGSPPLTNMESKERQATYYRTVAVHQFGEGKLGDHELLKEREIRQQYPPDEKLAECYRRIGKRQHLREEYASALESHKSALQTFQNLRGDMDEDIAISHFNIATVQEKMGDIESSRQSYQSALNLNDNISEEFLNFSCMESSCKKPSSSCYIL